MEFTAVPVAGLLRRLGTKGDIGGEENDYFVRIRRNIQNPLKHCVSLQKKFRFNWFKNRHSRDIEGKLDGWRNQRVSAFRLYDNGQLIIDKATGLYKTIPNPSTVPVLTVEEIKSKLPATVEWTQTLYLTGGLVKNGFSNNDADILTFDSITNSELALIRDYFTKLFGWKTDAGTRVMPEREPVYLFKIYEGGKLCQV